MKNPILERAADPLQYDGDEILWRTEGHGLSPIRRLFMEYLEPLIEDVIDVDALDVGCGQGWLVHELDTRGANAVGIDPSEKNIAAARLLYPTARFEHTQFSSYKRDQAFGLVTALMVFEHFPDLTDSMLQIRALMCEGGRFLLIAGDFDKFTQPRFTYKVDTEVIGDGEVATRTDYGERAGVIYDINRAPELFIESAMASNMELVTHTPIMATEWLIKEHPRYAESRSLPLFQLFEFKAV